MRTKRVVWLSGLFLAGILLISACSGPVLLGDNDDAVLSNLDLFQNWTAVPGNLVNSAWLYSVVWGDTAAGGAFVAVGMHGTIAYSADGKTWNVVPEDKKPFPTSALFNNDLNGVTWGAGKFVVVGVGADGTKNNDDVPIRGKTAYSMDGKTWQSTSNASGFEARDVTWGNYVTSTSSGRFVTVRRRGEITFSNDNATGWGPVSEEDRPFGSNITINGVSWGKDKFVVAGEGGKIAYSADGGRAWTQVINSTFGSGDINSVSWGNDKFIAAGKNGRMAYSADGITWIPVTDSTFGSLAINNVTWGNNMFVAVGDRGKMAYSVNGIVWMSLPIPTNVFDGDNIYDIAWGNNRWVAVGSFGKIAYCDIL